MAKKTTNRTNSLSAKMQRAEAIAAKLGVSPSSVWHWRRNKTLPRNPKIRAAYLAATKAKLRSRPQPVVADPEAIQ